MPPEDRDPLARLIGHARRCLAYFLLGILLPDIAETGQEAPPAPQPPHVISRDADGRATVRAVRVASPIQLDGRLEEAVYASVPPMSGFIQTEPRWGLAASEQTDAWVLFDDEAIYVAVRCRDSQPQRMVANEMRRDGSNLYQGEYVGFYLDTFYDRRNGYFFGVNPIGGRGDGQIGDERQYNGDWNAVWDVRVGRFDGGWTAEFAVPFKSLRYRPGPAHLWGFSIERLTKWKNELSFLTRYPVARGNGAGLQISAAATLVGLEVPARARNLEIKPYATSNLSSDAVAAPRISNDVGGDVGLDVKYGISENVVADLTYNTDFAHVEADEQQVNLTRFSVFFPEKREFFLENQGTFAFGGAATGQAANSSDTPILFYSRRIGLNQGRIVPIHGGGRVTGRLGRFRIGLLDMQSDDEPRSGTRSTNFSVVRVKRDVLRRSSIGAIYTGRSAGQREGRRNDTYGVDGTFAFFDNLSFNTYWARTPAAIPSGDDTSHRLQIDYNADRYGVQVERLFVGDDFNPGVGFVRRDDMRRHFAQVRFSPRPRSMARVRKFTWLASIANIENRAARLETREWNGEFSIQLQNSDQFILRYERTYEFLPQPFNIASGVTLPVGGYEFDSASVGYNFGQQRRVSGQLAIEHGTFYSGHKTAVTARRGRLTPTPKLSLEPTLSVNWVDLAEGSFTDSLFGSRVTYTMTPRMFSSALLQYSSATNTVAANVRLRWEYRPGSELFVVYNEQRDSRAVRFPALANRTVILKINRLFRL